MLDDAVRRLKPALRDARPLRATSCRAHPLGWESLGRNGFTLIEVLVALAVGGIVVVLAHRLFTGVADGARRVHEARVDLDHTQNGRRLLTQLAGSLDIGREGTGGFDGEPERAAFSTWFLDVNGWPESRRITLERSRDGFVVTGLAAAPVRLADSVTRAEFDYLLDYGADAAWVRTWKSPVSAPLAIRVRIERTGSVDTLLLIVGPRG